MSKKKKKNTGNPAKNNGSWSAVEDRTLPNWVIDEDGQINPQRLWDYSKQVFETKGFVFGLLSQLNSDDERSVLVSFDFEGGEKFSPEWAAGIAFSAIGTATDYFPNGELMFVKHPSGSWVFSNKGNWVFFPSDKENQICSGWGSRRENEEHYELEHFEWLEKTGIRELFPEDEVLVSAGELDVEKWF